MPIEYGFQRRDFALGRKGLRSPQNGTRVTRLPAASGVSCRHATRLPLAAKLAPFLAAIDSHFHRRHRFNHVPPTRKYPLVIRDMK